MSGSRVDGGMVRPIPAPDSDVVAVDFLTCPPETLQRLLAGAVQAYAARHEDGESFPALAAGTDIAATDVMVTVTAILKAVNIQAFELGMWQAWSGNH